MSTLITQYPAGMAILALSALVLLAAPVVLAVLNARGYKWQGGDW